MSFVERAIDVTISLGKGQNGEDGYDVVKLTGLRVAVIVNKVGAPAFNTADLRIYGVPLSVMNRVSSLWTPITTFRNNLISISAGDAQSGMSVVYDGAIATCWVNASAQPDVSLDVHAMVALPGLMKPVAPTSFRGSVDAAVIMSGLAAQMGYNFENNGVQSLLSNPYFKGTAAAQARACVRAAGIEMQIDDQTLAIWPKGGSRGGAVPLVAPNTGLVGYPAYNGSGIALKTMYNPSIKAGGKIQVKSSITAACGTWNVWTLAHDLQSQTPDGNWFSEITGKTVAFG